MKIAKVPHRVENGRTILLLKDKKPWEVSKGHQPHRGGAGLHADKRTKRAKTRQAVRQRVLAESY
jgi:hypothetical protein